eukprot:8435489-Alexandrium_andersonii.AAC.1
MGVARCHFDADAEAQIPAAGGCGPSALKSAKQLPQARAHRKNVGAKRPNRGRKELRLKAA